jgi:hypothetical protein
VIIDNMGRKSDGEKKKSKSHSNAERHFSIMKGFSEWDLKSFPF